MQSYAIILTTILVLIGTLVFIAKRYGSVKAEKKQSDRIAKERSKDAEISSGDFVNDPLDRML